MRHPTCLWPTIDCAPSILPHHAQNTLPKASSRPRFRHRWLTRCRQTGPRRPAATPPGLGNDAINPGIDVGKVACREDEALAQHDGDQLGQLGLDGPGGMATELRKLRPQSSGERCRCSGPRGPAICRAAAAAQPVQSPQHHGFLLWRPGVTHARCGGGALPPRSPPRSPAEASIGSLASVMHVACDGAGIVIRFFGSRGSSGRESRFS